MALSSLRKKGSTWYELFHPVSICRAVLRLALESAETCPCCPRRNTHLHLHLSNSDGIHSLQQASFVTLQFLIVQDLICSVFNAAETLKVTIA
jgi:hypothetical protein